MKKIKLTASILCIVFLLSFMFGGFAVAEPWDDEGMAVEIIPVYKNGIRVSDGIKTGETTYTQLRAFTDALDLDLDIAWDAKTSTASIKTEDLTLSATVGNEYFEANGRYFYVPDGITVYEGSLIVPIRAIAKVFNVGVLWDEETSSISLEIDDIRYIESGDDFYNEDDLYWLSRLINSESGNQTFSGKVAVGNVVLNRVEDPTCPNTIYDVIFDNKYGVQFSVTTGNAIYAEPNDESVIAAKVCLEGYNIAEDAIYFVNPKVGVTAWFLQTREYVATIGEHDFYA